MLLCNAALFHDVQVIPKRCDHIASWIHVNVIVLCSVDILVSEEVSRTNLVICVMEIAAQSRGPTREG